MSRYWLFSLFSPAALGVGRSPARRNLAAARLAAKSQEQVKQRSAEERSAAEAGAATAPAKSPVAQTKQAKKPSKSQTPQKEVAEELERAEEPPRDLGPPLVDDASALRRLNPEQPVWYDTKNKYVIVQGEACRAGYPLEFFATYSNRSYESVVAVNVTPSIIHAGLLLAGAVPGHPAQFRQHEGSNEPEVIPPTGTEIAIEVRWKDSKGTVQSAPAQQWVRNRATKKALDTNWVFAGSMFVTDESGGKKYYRADTGEMICVLSLSGAMLDLPISNYRAMDARSFEAFAEHLPPPDTPVTLILKPILGPKPNEAAFPTSEKRAEAEKAAVAAADAWLALVDRGEYARSWETAADYLKDTVDRKEFVKLLGAIRKPLGAVKSRQLESRVYMLRMPGAPTGNTFGWSTRHLSRRRQWPSKP